MELYPPSHGYEWLHSQFHVVARRRPIGLCSWKRDADSHRSSATSRIRCLFTSIRNFYSSASPCPHGRFEYSSNLGCLMRSSPPLFPLSCFWDLALPLVSVLSFPVLRCLSSLSGSEGVLFIIIQARALQLSNAAFTHFDS